MFDFWYYWSDKQRWLAIGAGVLVILGLVGGVAIKNHNDAVTRERIAEQAKKDEEAEKRKRNFTTLKKPYKKAETKEVSNVSVRKKLMGEDKKKVASAPNEFKDSSQSKLERPDDITMKLLDSKEIDWDNIYLTGPQFKYVVVRILLAQEATDVKVHDDQVRVILNGGYGTKGMQKISKKSTYVVGRAYQASSYGDGGSTSSITYISGNTKYKADMLDYDNPADDY